MVTCERHQLWERRKETGFTMIELLIVVVVLGILASIVIFGLGTVASSSAQAACNSDGKSVETAIQTFRTNPANTADRFNLPNASSATPSGNSQLTAAATSHYGGPYLRTWPTSSHYSISIDGNGHVYVNPPGGSTQSAATNFDSNPSPCSLVQ